MAAVTDCGRNTERLPLKEKRVSEARYWIARGIEHAAVVEVAHDHSAKVSVLVSNATS